MNKQKVVISGSLRKHNEEISQVFQQFKNSDAFIVTAPISTEIERLEKDYVVLVCDNPNKSRSDIEQEFLEKVKEADLLYVVNKDGYIGKSVACEICWAILNNVPVLKACNQESYSIDVPQSIQKIINLFSVYLESNNLTQKDATPDSHWAQVEYKINNLKHRAQELLKTLGPLSEKEMEKMINDLLFEIDAN
jgi:hypothetical protein